MSERPSGIAIPWWRVALYVTVSLGFFRLGFVPMWFKANSAIEQREVHLTQLQNSMGAAMVDAQRGEYKQPDRLQAIFIQTCAPVGRTAVTNLTLDARILSYSAVGVYLLMRR